MSSLLRFFKPLPKGETYIPPSPKHSTEPPSKRQKIGPGRPRKDKGEAFHLSVTEVTEITNLKDEVELHKPNIDAVKSAIIPKDTVENVSIATEQFPVPAVDKLDFSKDMRDIRQSPGSAKSPARGKYTKWDITNKIRIVQEAKLCGIRPIAAKYHLAPSTLSSWMKMDFSKTIQRIKKGSIPGAGRPLTY
ncbi:hypothetical protein ACJMK2_042027 [Sinanodonta woodiana]|uniref:HTH psq-type domain-containing protein n=1 Tax=Sinanodonta woodiana TaxID=1069815 RepID=A0ABD3W925_SINWO